MAEKSEKSFPFDAELVNGKYDREYVSEDFARYFRAFISSGIFLDAASSLQVLANDDMSVTLKTGSIIIEGYRYDNTADLTINLAPADGVLNRIDRIAITWDQEQRNMHFSVLEGEPSYNAIAVEPRRNAEYKDYILADINVSAGAITITQTDITDQRLNSEVCGLAAPFMKVDTQDIYAQLEAFYEETVKSAAKWEEQQKQSFDDWFEEMKNQLTDDAAGNLQNQIDRINASRITTYADVMANTVAGYTPDALVIKEGFEQVNNKLTASDGTAFRFGYNSETGEYGYIVADSEGADTFCPFSNAKKLYEALQYSGLVTEDMTFDEMCAVLAEVYPCIVNYVLNGTLQNSITLSFSHFDKKESGYDDDGEWWGANLSISNTRITVQTANDGNYEHSVEGYFLFSKKLTANGGKVETLVSYSSGRGSNTTSVCQIGLWDGSSFISIGTITNGTAVSQTFSLPKDGKEYSIALRVCGYGCSSYGDTQRFYDINSFIIKG